MKPDTEKLQKVLAREGVGSRRELERWIAEGRISVNGRTAKIGDRVSSKDLIQVDGRTVNTGREEQPLPRVLLYHKPMGEICTRHDDEERPTVFSALPPLSRGRWVGVGRLEVNTAGLLLFTDDGELANRLIRATRALEQEYAVRVLGEPSDETLTRLMHGGFNRLIHTGGQGANHWYHVVVAGNSHRLVRSLWESEGLTVSRLIRIRFGPLSLPRELPQGKWLELSATEVKQLTKMR